MAPMEMGIDLQGDEPGEDSKCIAVVDGCRCGDGGIVERAGSVYVVVV
jgi:hypothetical protein